MKTNNTFRLSLLSFSFFLMFYSGKNYAALNPIAEAVKKKHELKIVFPAYNLFKNTNTNVNENIRKALTSGTSADIIPEKLYELVHLAPPVVNINLPFNGKTLSVDLVSVSFFTENFSILTSDHKAVSYTPGVYYRGTIKGNPNSIAAFSFFNDELYGVVSDVENGNIIVGKFLTPGNTSRYIIYSDKNLLHPIPNYCKTVLNPGSTLKINGSTLSNTVASTLKCARFYYEIDNNIFLDNNSNVTNTTNWITAVHNNVSALYSNDNISVSLSQIYIWTTSDPYIGLDEIEQLALFHTNRPSFTGDVGQLVSRDGGYYGIADTVNGLCTSLNYSYTDVEFEFLAIPTYS